MLRVGFCGVLCTILILIILLTQMGEPHVMKILVYVCLAIEIISGLLLLIGIAKKKTSLMFFWIVHSYALLIYIVPIYIWLVKLTWRPGHTWPIAFVVFVLWFVLFGLLTIIKNYLIMLAKNPEIPSREDVHTESSELSTMGSLPHQPTQMSPPSYESLQIDPPPYDSIQKSNDSGARTIYIISMTR